MAGKDFLIPLSGRLNLKDVGIAVGKNFTKLKNFLTAPDGLEPVPGMTKINSTVLPTANKHPQNAHHFRKDSPSAESHILVQTVNSSDAVPVIIQNESTIPNTGDFDGGATPTALYTENTGAGIARFSDVPNGQVVICDGKESLIWGGDEMPVAAVILSSAIVPNATGGIDNPQDFTVKLKNSSSDADQLMSIGNILDAKVLLHCDGTDGGSTFTDAMGNHTLTATNTITDTDDIKFGTAAAYFDGTGDSVEIDADHADFDLSATDGGIDLWVKPQAGTSAAEYTIYHHDKNGDTSTLIWIYLHKYTMLLLNGNGGITDSSLNTKTVTRQGTGGSIDIANPRFGIGAIKFEGSDYLQVAAHADFDFSINDSYTIEMWIRPVVAATGTSQTLFFHYTASNYLLLTLTDVGGVSGFHVFSGNSNQVDSAVLSDNTWTHVVQVCNGTIVSLYINGVRVDTETVTTDIIDLSSANILIGAQAAGATKFTGLMDDISYSSNAKYDPTLLTLAVPTVENRNIAHTEIQFDTDIIKMPTDDITADKYHHIEVNYDVSEPQVYIYTDGRLHADGVQAMTITAAGDIDGLPHFGTKDDNSTAPYKGWMDEIRWTKGLLLHVTDFSVKEFPYGEYISNFLIASPRPLEGVKLFVETPNATTSILTMKEWDGSDWSGIAITDNTAVGGVSLAQTGTVTWASTVNTAKPRYFEGYYLYFYNFNLSAGEADIYQITLQAPVQPCLDMWDGNPRPIFSYQIYSDSVFNDYSTNVALDMYDTGNEATFVTAIAPATGLQLLLSSEIQYVGSFERLTGIVVGVIGGAGNEATATLTISYWNGSSWIALTDIQDGTLGGGVTYAKSGVITWQVPDETVEFKTELAGRIPLYYYKIVASANFTDKDIQVYHIIGIPAQKKIGNWRFGFHADQCLWLCDDVNGNRNEVMRSAPNAPEIFNGKSSFRIRFGDEKRLIGAAVVNVKHELTESIADVKLFWKRSMMYGLSGYNQDSYRVFEISTEAGCVASLTIKNVLIDIKGQTMPGVIWMGPKGIYIWANDRPVPIHWDIRNFFDFNESNGRKFHASYIDRSIIFINHGQRRAHFLFADGNSSGELNREFVTDMRNPGNWSEIYRTDVVAFTVGGGTTGVTLNIGDTITCNSQTAEVLYVDLTSGAWASNTAAGDIYLVKKTGAFAAGAITISGVTYATASGDSANLNLQCAITVEDTIGNRYNYGFVDTGYMERLDYGTSMDGKDIIHQFKTGDIALHQDNPMYETLLQALTLFMQAKTTTTSEVTMIHRGDGIQAGTIFGETYDLTKSGYDFVGIGKEQKNIHEGTHAFHSFEGIIATNDETIGPEFVALGGFYDGGKIREDKN